MRTIWKFTILHDNVFNVPIGAEILSAHEQRGEVSLWMLVDPSAEREPRRFASFWTGAKIPDTPIKFIGTVHLDGGATVFHVFEILPPWDKA